MDIHISQQHMASKNVLAVIFRPSNMSASSSNNLGRQVSSANYMSGGEKFGLRTLTMINMYETLQARYTSKVTDRKVNLIKETRKVMRV